MLKKSVLCAELQKSFLFSYLHCSPLKFFDLPLIVCQRCFGEGHMDIHKTIHPLFILTVLNYKTPNETGKSTFCDTTRACK